MSIRLLSELRQLMEHSLKKSYRKRQNLSVKQRYRAIADCFDVVLDRVGSRFEKEARTYYRMRTKSDRKLKAIERRGVQSLKRVVGDGVIVRPASSFTARMNLIGESDLDIVLLVEKPTEDRFLEIANGLGLAGFKLTEIRGQHRRDRGDVHWVFQKFIDGIEVEAKMQSYHRFKEFIKMHDYLENKMSIERKILATYTKYLFAKYDRKGYNLFKKFYYTCAGHHGKSTRLLYPLLD